MDAQVQKPQKALIAVITSLLLVAIAALIAVEVYLFMTRFDNSIEKIERTQNNIGGVVSTNYSPTIAENVNWSELNDEDREGLARDAVAMAIDTAQADNASLYTVTGISAAERSVLFLYTGEDVITIFVGEDTRRVPLSAP